MDVRIVLCGCGRAGQTFLGLIRDKERDLAARYGLSLKVVAAVDIGGAAVAPDGLPLTDLVSHLQNRNRVEALPGFGRPGVSGKEVLSSNSSRGTA